MHDGQVCASNVTKIARCVVAVDSQGIQQLMFYDKGVGTGHFDRIRGGAFGLGIEKIWYKIAGLGNYIRPIGQHTKESAAGTALDRSANTANNYQPPNLKEFLAHGGAASQVP
jgi:hypothetical protein